MSNNQKQEIMTNSNAVKVTKNPTTGVIVEQNPNKPEYGWIRVEKRSFGFGNAVNGSKNKSALISVIYADAIKAVASGEIYEGMELPGKIITIESMIQEPRMKPKQAGKDGGFCLKGGKQIFFKTEYTEVEEATDVLIQHDSISAPVTTEVASKAKLNS